MPLGQGNSDSFHSPRSYCRHQTFWSKDALRGASRGTTRWSFHPSRGTRCSQQIRPEGDWIGIVYTQPTRASFNRQLISLVGSDVSNLRAKSLVQRHMCEEQLPRYVQVCVPFDAIPHNKRPGYKCRMAVLCRMLVVRFHGLLNTSVSYRVDDWLQTS